MKKLVLLILIILQAQNLLRAQTSETDLQKKTALSKSNIGSFSALLPVGVFQRSHFAGAGLDYSWSPYRFGQSIKKANLIGFTANAGLAYFLGKKINTVGYDFRYAGYLYFHALAGIIANPSAATNLCLMAGPTLGIYDGHADAGVGLNFSAGYFIDKKISIGPSLLYRKHKNTDALWAIAIRASYAF